MSKHLSRKKTLPGKDFVKVEDAKYDPEAFVVEAKAGDVVVFSSLTPHRTGPNLTKSTRKSYILQYAPDGAVVHQLDGSVEDANNPERQYFVYGPR